MFGCRGNYYLLPQKLKKNTFGSFDIVGLIKVVYTITDASEEEPDTQSANILNEYSDVFKGIGEFQGECSFRIDPSIPPVVCPPRRVSFALREHLKS